MYDAGKVWYHNGREERCFREMFGVAAQVTLIAWSMLNTLVFASWWNTDSFSLDSLLSEDPLYPKQGPLSVLCGNADHKTITKWVWPFISALADLEPHLVSYHCVVELVACFPFLNSYFLC